MSQSAARAGRRECRRRGHVPKTDGNGAAMCARCLISLTDDAEEAGRGGARKDR